MSEHPESADVTAPAPAATAVDGGRGRGGPEPESIRFFATTWVGHDVGYGARRVGVAVGSLAAAVAGCLVLRFAYQGLEIADVGAFVDLLVVVVFAVCGAIAFRATWDGFTRRPADPAREESLRSVRMIGFIGSLIAYFLRSLTEAPGEGLRRREYEKAVSEYERRRAARTGSPSTRGTGGNKGRRPKRK
ncbi:hypothetical protein ACIOJD_33195 [Streptomyces sp. NPDC088116]|uniref:hypothetical protein n=1 Tax=Streptomyces sp. NPDC088116 TaxID=3365825 RepID=UPI0037FE31A4